MAGIRYLVAGSFIDGNGAAALRNVFLAVQDGVITAIGAAAALPRLEGTAIDDFSHCTILPALVDCSLFLSRSPAVDNGGEAAAESAGAASKPALVDQHIRYCHAHGVLGAAVGDDGAELGIDGDAGGGQGLIEMRSSGRPGRGGEGGAAARPDSGDFLRIEYSGPIEERELAFRARFHPEELGRILQHRGHKKAVVVANGRQQVAEALNAGCDAIEQGYGLGEDHLREMARRGVLWIPGLLRAKNALDGAGAGGSVCCRFSQRYVAPGKPDPGAEAFWKQMLAGQLAQLRLARNLGVTTAVGTGAGGVGLLHGESMVEEMKLFIKAGYSLEETIRCASANGARFFGMEKLGTLSPGRKATFLIARGTPKQLPRKLSYLEGIYVEGAPSRAYRKNPMLKRDGCSDSCSA